MLYRLNVLELNIPSLKERDEDAIEIFKYFLNKRISIDEYKLEVSYDILNILTLYSWPGNIRELQNVTERFCLFLSLIKTGEKVKYNELLIRSIGEDRLLSDILKQNGVYEGNAIEKENITKDLLRKLESVFPYNKEKLAQKIGISRTTLWRMEK